MPSSNNNKITTGTLYIIILLGVLIVSYLSVPTAAESLTIIDGVAVVPHQGPAVRYTLQGSWQLTIDQQEKQFVQVPSVAWEQGSGIYSLDVEWDGKPTAFEFFTSNAGTSYELWVNGMLIGSSGRYGVTEQLSRPSAKPEVFSFMLMPGKNHFEVKVSNFVHPRGGLWEQVYLAKSSTISSWYQRWVAIDHFLFGQLFLFFFLQLSLAFFSKGKGPYAFFAFGILFVAFGNLMRNAFALYSLFPTIEYLLLKRLQIITYYLAAGFFVYAFQDWFKTPLVVKSAKLFFVFCLVLALLSLLVPYSIMYNFAIAFVPTMFIFLMYRVWIQLRLFKTSLYSASMASLVLQIIADVVLSYGMSHDFISILTARYDLQMIPYMTYVYVTLHTMVLAKDYILADREIERAKTQIILNTTHQRQRLANDLHDGVGQLLHAIDYLTEGLLQSKQFDRSKMQTIRDTSKESVIQLRQIVDDLNPIRFGSTSLGEALHALASRMERVYGIETICSITGDSLYFDGVISQNLYFVYSEAVKNAVSHAKPKKIRILLHVTENLIHGSVENDGVDAGTTVARSLGHGISIMRYRVELHGGTFDIMKKQEDSILIQFTIPRRKADDSSYTRR